MAYLNSLMEDSVIVDKKTLLCYGVYEHIKSSNASMRINKDQNSVEEFHAESKQCLRNERYILLKVVPIMTIDMTADWVVRKMDCRQDQDQKNLLLLS